MRPGSSICAPPLAGERTSGCRSALPRRGVVRRPAGERELPLLRVVPEAEMVRDASAWTRLGTRDSLVGKRGSGEWREKAVRRAEGQTELPLFPAISGTESAGEGGRLLGSRRRHLRPPNQVRPVGNRSYAISKDGGRGVCLFGRSPSGSAPPESRWATAQSYGRLGCCTSAAFTGRRLRERIGKTQRANGRRCCIGAGCRATGTAQSSAISSTRDAAQADTRELRGSRLAA